MNKYLLLLSLLVVPMVHGEYSCGDCNCDIVGHSFFSVRPYYQSASPERVTLFRDRLHARDDQAYPRCCGRDAALELTFFGGKTKDAARLSTFFGPSCKPVLTVASENSSNVGPSHRDIAAENFDIYLKEADLAFESSICFSPQQIVKGLGITYKQAIYERCAGQWFWFELSAPLTHVENKMCIRESIKSSGETITSESPSSMSAAFANPEWKYGRIDPSCKNSETRFADLEIKVGYEWLSNDCCFFESYIGALAPTGNRVTACSVFEPIVGHNNHTGMICGSSGVFEWWRDECCDCYAEFALDWNTLYLFEKVEMRSFDLLNKPWSRYMPVYTSKAQAEQAAYLSANDRADEGILLGEHGINVFTKPLCVKPRFSHTFNAAFLLTSKNLQTEVGYNLYFRSSECVKLACPWQDGVALKAVSGSGNTNRYQNIGEQLIGLDADVAGYDENIIKECDLDLSSAAHPAVLTHTFYGSMGRRWDCRKYPLFAGIGFSYEFADDNAAADRWIGWAKAGVSF